MADGAYYGMVTFDQSLATLLATGRITLAEAMATATNPHDLKVMLERQGILQTGSFAAASWPEPSARRPGVTGCSIGPASDPAHGCRSARVSVMADRSCRPDAARNLH